MTYSVNFANYTIGKEAYKNVNEVCRQYGTKALLIGGKLALEAGKEKLLQALAEGEIRSRSWIQSCLERTVPMPGWKKLLHT